MYKDPFSAVFSIILPLILLAIINLFIFFQSNDLGSRIASIATLLVAFMAFLPTVRELIPPTPTVIGLDIILLLFLVAELLTAIQAMLAFDIPAEEYKFQWTTDPIYLICVAFIMLVALPVLIMVVLHYARWVGQYHNKDKNTSTDINFSSSKWFNEDVDVYLKELKERQDGTLEELKSSQTN